MPARHIISDKWHPLCHDKGIVITGGGALLDGVDELLSHELKVPVFVAESPLTCVVEGTGVLLENIPLLENGLNKNY